MDPIDATTDPSNDTSTRPYRSGILIATIVMIHFLMLTNLFINFDSMNIKGLRFLKRVSFFNYAYEGARPDLS